MNMGRLDEKVAIITGGANGFGAATAKRFIGEGCNVIIADINDEAGSGLAKTLGAQCIFVHCDHTEETDCQQTVKVAKDRWGKLDILFCNAGIGKTASFFDTDDAVLSRVIDINLIGPWRMTKAAIKDLVEAGGREENGGVLLYTSSALGLQGERNSSAYVASKHGVIGLMRSLAKEYGPQNIRVNAICPGISDTDVGRATDGWGDPDKVLNAIRSATPLKKLIEPIDIANAALFLASDEGRLVHSVTLCVDGGGAF
jgi:3-oxoacyl-[acyl-carrier protein] reductase